MKDLVHMILKLNVIYSSAGETRGQFSSTNLLDSSAAEKSADRAAKDEHRCV